jgi:hypothetical protein
VKPRTRLAVVSIVAALAGLLGASLADSHRANMNPRSDSLASLPAAPAPALQIGAVERLGSGRFLSRWATVRASGSAYSRPTTRAAVIGRLERRTPEGTPNALPVLESRTDSRGRLWVAVRLPALPSGRIGWVRRQALGGYESADTHLIVDRVHLQAALYRRGRAVFSAPVGIGTPSWPTPAGHFLIRNELTRYASPFYGPVAFGTTARSVLTDWPGGGFVGIHGTDHPELIPGRVSHGCIRMRNSDVLRLATLMPVGTPLTIR